MARPLIVFGILTAAFVCTSCAAPRPKPTEPGQVSGRSRLEEQICLAIEHVIASTPGQSDFLVEHRSAGGRETLAVSKYSTAKPVDTRVADHLLVGEVGGTPPTFTTIKVNEGASDRSSRFLAAAGGKTKGDKSRGASGVAR